MNKRSTDSIIVGLGSLSLLVCSWIFPAAGQELSSPIDPDSDVWPRVVRPDDLSKEKIDSDAILDLDLERLGKVDVIVPSFDVEVMSVTRSKSSVGKSSAAVFVVTQDMIRRSSATNIPELLRMVPGLNVARIDASKWAVSARGFNSRFANKLLVMIDGRSVYTPLFSGVYWDVQDTLLEDIDRIEVIRGPGATVWGANAVNGVINIVTKKAKNTQGALITSGGGSEDRTINGVRYGGKIGSGLSYRVYGKHFERDTGSDPAGAHDDWRQGRVGFRTDWTPDPCDYDTLTFQGDFYEGHSGTSSLLPSPPPPPLSLTLIEDRRVSGANLLTSWTHQIDDESHFSLQLYYDRAERSQRTLKQVIDTFDFDFVHIFPFAEHHGITWGIHDRYISDDLSFPEPFVLTFEPDDSRQTNLISAFIQDEITLVDDTLSITVGSKFEHNDFTGFEYQPSARLLWAPDKRKAAWASISRAVRTPARSDDDVRLTLASLSPFSTTTFNAFGDRNVESEDLLAYEIGYRAQPSDQFSWDIAAFFNRYDDLIGFQLGSTILPPPTTIFPLIATNGIDGETYGVEVAANYEISPCWKVHGWYSFLQMQLHAVPGLTSTAESIEGSSPQNQVYLQSSWEFFQNLEFDVMGRYIDSLPALAVKSYISLDLRLGWRPNDHWEFSVVGQNLLEGHRRESSSVVDAIGSEVDRGVFAHAIWRH